MHVWKGECRPAAPLSALPLELSPGDVQLYTHQGTMTAQGRDRCGEDVKGQEPGRFFHRPFPLCLE